MLPGISWVISPPFLGIFICCNEVNAICGEKLCFPLKELQAKTTRWERLWIVVFQERAIFVSSHL